MEKIQNQENERSLSAFLEKDREMVMAQLGADRDPDRAAAVLEKEVDRLMYRAGDMDSVSASAAQGMLQVLKNALPLTACVSEAEMWEKDPGAKGASGIRLPLPAILCLIAGAVLAASALASRGITAAVPALAGGVLLAAGGYIAGKGRRAAKNGSGRSPKDRVQMQQRFLTDPDRIWHILQGVMLSADHSLMQEKERMTETARGEEANASGGAAASAGQMQKADLRFFSDLLENEYARRRQMPADEAAAEQIGNIRYYLHERGIETEDYTTQSAKWFELLPSDQGTVTIRPAFVKDGILLMKGVASG